MLSDIYVEMADGAKITLCGAVRAAITLQNAKTEGVFTVGNI